MEKNEQKQAPKGGKKRLVLILVLCGILVAAGVCAAIAFGGGAGGAAEGEVRLMDIKTAYVTMQYPEAFKENLSHREIIEGGVTSEIFSLLYNEQELELFRICFGEGVSGEPAGYLHTDAGVIPVTLVIADYEALVFTEEEEEVKDLYFSMLENASTVMASLYKDVRYSENKNVNTENKAEVQLTYFAAALPEAVQWEESTQGGIYKAVFSTTVGAEKIMLYTVSIGEPEAGSLLGYYDVDGKNQPVCIATGDLDALQSMEEEDRTAVYLLMDTVNDVVQGIMAEKNFVTPENVE